jgi:hypothetical protein
LRVSDASTPSRRIGVCLSCYRKQPIAAVWVCGAAGPVVECRHKCISDVGSPNPRNDDIWSVVDTSEAGGAESGFVVLVRATEGKLLPEASCTSETDGVEPNSQFEVTGALIQSVVQF